MAFYFDESKLQPKTIEIDLSAVTCDSPEVKRRMDRIETNYQQLDEVLGQLEIKLGKNETLKASDAKAAQAKLEKEAAALERQKARAARKAKGLPNQPR